MTLNCNKINIKQGSKGEEVKELQKYLKYLGYYSYTIDGECGTETVNAIKQLQKQYNIKQDGIFAQISCKTSEINGKDISTSYITLENTTWKNMMSRYNNYITSNNKEPNICYIDIENPYQYITNEKYKEILSRYDKFIKENGREPICCYINTPVVNITSSGSNSNNTSTSDNNNSTEITFFQNSPHFVGTGCNKLGQCNSHNCGPHSLHQVLCKFNITDYTELKLASIAGTTSSGTGHSGLNTAVAWVNKQKGSNISIEWKNFSDFGSTVNERFRNIGVEISNINKDVIFHNKYRNKWGHYETVKAINTKNKTVTVLNSLGNRCNSPAYCGYLETRSFNTFASYLAGISQPSVAILTKK